MTVQELSIDGLQNQWKEIYQTTLPQAAKSKLPSQSKWPVHNDHCFARIILDSTVGISSLWTSKLKSPAYKNMSREQLQASIALAEQILNGEADLVELDEKSLALRGKMGKKSAIATSVVSSSQSPEKSRNIAKRDRESSEDISQEEETPSPEPSKRRKSNPRDPATTKTVSKPQNDNDNDIDLTPFLKQIALSSQTPFQKRVLTLLCQVPRGQYSTYGMLSKELSSSPRAVGNALRNNPFAPQVPCHRILATGGGLGGFKGSWGRKGAEGVNDGEKRRLLTAEGVRFDGGGRVVGAPWEGFRSIGR